MRKSTIILFLMSLFYANAELPEYFTVHEADGTVTSYSISKLDKITFDADASGGIGVYVEGKESADRYPYQGRFGMTFETEKIGVNGDESSIVAVETDDSSLLLTYDPIAEIVSAVSSESVQSLHVYNVSGQAVKAVSSEADRVNISVSDLKQGVYVVRAITDNETQCIKIIKR
ncbi:MAG: T9SS type A sorting domain-containing protein [Bacteroidales bacterium]|nr:T9SS type A sorting domain-containing protein [Bacteroidales bacterium]